jgi:hypothetical protein
MKVVRFNKEPMFLWRGEAAPQKSMIKEKGVQSAPFSLIIG